MMRLLRRRRPAARRKMPVPTRPDRGPRRPKETRVTRVKIPFRTIAALAAAAPFAAVSAADWMQFGDDAWRRKCRSDPAPLPDDADRERRQRAGLSQQRLDERRNEKSTFPPRHQ